MLIRRDEHSIDKKFRQHLYDAEQNPPLHLWDDVRAKSQRKRRPMFWWFVSAAAVSVACVSSLLWLQTGTNKNQTNVIVQHMETTNPIASKEDTVKSQMRADAPAPSAHKNERARTINDEMPNGHVQNEIASLVIEDTSGSGRKNKRSGNTEKKRDDFRELQAQIQVSNLSDYSALGNEPAVGIVDPNPSMNGAMANEPKQANTSFESEILDDSSLPMHNTASMSLPVAQPSRLSVGVYYAVSAPHRVGANGSSENELNQLQSRTKFGRAYSYGMALNYALYKGIYVSASIETSSFKESHTWFDSTRTQRVVFNENQVATYYDGSTVPIYVTVVDTTEQETIDVLKSTHSNSYTSMNVPLLVGANIPLTKRISILAEAGPVFRVEKSTIGSLVFANGIQSPAETNIASADVLHSNLDYVYLNEFYSNWKTDMHVGLYMSAHIWKGWSMNAGAQVRWMLEKNDELKPLSHRIVQPGIRVGVGCRL